MKMIKKLCCVAVSVAITVAAMVPAFSFTACAETEGSVVGLQQLTAPSNVRAEDATLYWDEVENAASYKILLNGEEYTAYECSFDLSELADGEYEIEVFACGDGETYGDSSASKYTYTADDYSDYYDAISGQTSGYDEQGFYYTLLADGSGYEVSKGTAKLSESVKIPDFYNGLPVKRIANEGFGEAPGVDYYFCNVKVREFILPKYLEEIGWYAFCYYFVLESIDIPDSVKKIGNCAFEKCLQLKQVTLPEGLEYIGAGSFMDCSLQELVLPQSLKIMDGMAFKISAYDAQMSRNFGHQLGIEEIWPEATFTSVVIPANLKTISHSVFCGCAGLTSVTIPSSVEEIGSSAFARCTSLASVTIPASVKKILGGAFKQCTSLADITIESSANIEYFGKYVFDYTAWAESQTDGAMMLGDGDILYGFKGETEGEYTVPDGVKVIASGAFLSADFTKITIPDEVRLIGESAFSFCTSLTDIKLPSSLKEVSSSTFCGCSALMSITIPDGVTTIEGCAFANCTSLTDVVIPDSVTSFGDQMFTGCTSLAAVPAGVKEITAKMFMGCKSLKSVTIPEGATAISAQTFSGCTALESVTIPDSVTSIEANAFNNCKSLAEITLPESLTQIGRNAFYKCSALTSITIPEGVTSIGIAVFSGCTALENAIFEDAVGWVVSSSTDSYDVPKALCDWETAAVYLTETYVGLAWTKS